MNNLWKRILSSFKANLQMIIFAFVISVACWFLVSIQIFPTVDSSVSGIALDIQPTEFMNQNNLEITNLSEIAKVVDIGVAGKRYDVTGLTSEDFIASVDMSSVRSPGTYTLPIDVEAQNKEDCTIKTKEPGTVLLEVDEIVSKEFSVEANLDNITPLDGYYIKNSKTGDDRIEPSPNVVTLRGSASEIAKITRVEAVPIFSGSLVDTQELECNLVAYTTSGASVNLADTGLTASNTSGSVYVQVYKQKELPLKLTLANFPSNFDIDSLSYTIQPETLTLAAPDDSIDYLSELDIGTIDISDIKLNQTVTVPINLPDGYINLSGNSNVRVVWNIADYGKLDYFATQITLANVPENFDVSLITNELQLSVIGPSDELSNLTAEDFYVTANLLGVALHDGSQDVSVSVRIKGTSVKCWVQGAYKVTVYAQSVSTDGL